MVAPRNVLVETTTKFGGFAPQGWHSNEIWYVSLHYGSLTHANL